MLVEKVTRKIEIDEANGSHIHIRDTTHLVDDQTNEIIYPNVNHHRKVINVGDDAQAEFENLKGVSDTVWTPEVRSRRKGRQ